MAVFLTGEKHIGKSTVINKVLDGLGLEKEAIAGFRTLSLVGERRDIYIVPAYQRDLEEGACYAGSCKDGRRLDTNLMAFDRYGLWCLKNPAQPSLVLLDEIGNMEREAGLFCQAVKETILRKDCIVLGVIQKRSNGPLADFIRSNVKILEIDLDNRDGIVDSLIQELKDGMLC